MGKTGRQSRDFGRRHGIWNFEVVTVLLVNKTKVEKEQSQNANSRMPCLPSAAEWTQIVRCFCGSTFPLPRPEANLIHAGLSRSWKQRHPIHIYSAATPQATEQQNMAEILTRRKAQKG